MSTRPTSQERTLTVEHRSIDYIPPDERHGKPESLFNVWFAANMQVTAIVTGALLIVIGLSLPWAILAALIGVAAGTIFMALHSVQGPKLGIPQMIQSRAQFGYYGAAVPIIVVLLMYIGFFASSSVLGGQALTGLTHLPVKPTIIIIAAICTIVAIFGYRLIHSVERWVSLISGLGFVYLTIMLFVHHDVAAVWNGGHFSGGAFGLGIAIAATWTLTYAPYVADYSRYLPEDTSSRTVFWWSYAGCSIGSFWMIGFGCIAVAVATQAFNGGSVSFIVDLSPSPVHWLFQIIIILGIIAVNVLNLYGAFMSWTTIATAAKSHGVSRTTRAAYTIAVAAISTILAIAGQGNFLENFENFILFLAYFVIPWTAINLVDFYLIRKEQYDIGQIFEPNGIYGRASWEALVAYFAAIAVEIPFMSTSFYTGPMVAHLGGADISWILGLIVSAVLYWLFMRHRAAHLRPAQTLAPSSAAPGTQSESRG
ncbi:purine-cytosine permease family protein [Segeticoccus rhizosphaerae]|jgi:NCS1 family nucleobase:cation symporter-1|uniref:purine-cytosine permease family protein n=1 Tax=Segeticoccus rhizosphaerae TaxID=1104777 RepID=UPI0012655ECC|nr:cytosine permease [Segeticoccus rhizosphaerae]